MLRQLGKNFDVSEDGSKAIQLVKNRSISGQPMYRLILMDYSMPFMWRSSGDTRNQKPPVCESAGSPTIHMLLDCLHYTIVHRHC